MPGNSRLVRAVVGTAGGGMARWKSHPFCILRRVPSFGTSAPPLFFPRLSPCSLVMVKTRGGSGKKTRPHCYALSFFPLTVSRRGSRAGTLCHPRQACRVEGNRRRPGVIDGAGVSPALKRRPKDGAEVDPH